MIVEKLNENEKIKITDLSPGDCFEYENKFYTILDYEYPYADGIADEILCVVLSNPNGKTHGFHSDTEIEVIPRLFKLVEIEIPKGV